MFRLALLGPLCLLLSACSCNGQKHVEGPAVSCDADAISANYDEIYGAIGQAFDSIDVSNCEAAGTTVHDWLDRYGDLLRQTVAMDKQCTVETRPDMKPHTWQEYARVEAVLDGKQCESARTAYARYSEISGASKIPIPLDDVKVRDQRDQ